MKKMLLYFIAFFTLSIFTTGCGDATFQGAENDSLNNTQGFQVKGGVPYAIAAGGKLQNHSVMKADYQRSLPMVESLIGQPIGAKIHKKNGVVISVGYPDLQSHFISQ